MPIAAMWVRVAGDHGRESDYVAAAGDEQPLLTVFADFEGVLRTDPADPVGGRHSAAQYGDNVLA
jgi:hypothetical protein